MQFTKWLRRRESGLRSEMGDHDSLMKRLYETTTPYHMLNPKTESEYGGVFNLEFSPEGKVLVSACEKKTILLFDVNSTNSIHMITDAHTDNVNCIRFIDDRIFATCSDDTTVALWDLRCMKSKLRTLHGHSNWVKNIEYSQKEKVLVTSGFDGSIFTWDINSHTENGLLYQKVFHTSGLMRCRIAPEIETGEKLVICTTGGYMMVIHNLDLSTLLRDLSGFRPIIYRLMQMGEQYIPQAAKYAHVFSKKQKKNRVEFITDFPENNDAEVILSLQIHPKGHSFLSRNINYDESSEWSCIHNISEDIGSERSRRKRKFNSEDEDEDDSNDEDRHRDRNPSNEASDVIFSINRRNHPRLRLRRDDISPALGSAQRTLPQQQNQQQQQQQQNGNSNQQQRSPFQQRAESFVPDIWAAEVTVQERAIRQNRARNSNSVTGYNFVYAISSGVLPARFPTPSARLTEFLRQSRANNTTSNNNNNNNNNNNDNSDSSTSSSSSTISVTSLRRHNNRRSSESDTNTERVPPSPNRDTSSSFSALVRRARLGMFNCPESNPFSLEPPFFENPKKLLYYIEESNKGKGYIKEPCFSSDGRIVCSPYEKGVRLLAFNETCSEPTFSSTEHTPQPLTVVSNIQPHLGIVLCAKFCPNSQLLATGCRNGNIIWHYPRI